MGITGIATRARAWGLILAAAAGLCSFQIACTRVIEPIPLPVQLSGADADDALDPLTVAVRPTTVPVALVPTTQPIPLTASGSISIEPGKATLDVQLRPPATLPSVELRLERAPAAQPVELVAKGSIELTPSTRPVVAELRGGTIRVEPSALTVQLADAADPDAPPLSLSAFLDEHLIWILGTLLGVAGYLRIASGDIARKRKRLVESPGGTEAQHAQTQKVLDELRRRYLANAVAEGVMLLLVIVLLLRLVRRDWFDWIAQFLTVCVPIVLLTLHILLWLKAAPGWRWRLQDAPSGGTPSASPPASPKPGS